MMKWLSHEMFCSGSFFLQRATDCGAADMIYRILIDTVAYQHDPITRQLYSVPSGTRLRGVFTAGFSEGLADIPYPRITNPRARFYFTEIGWRTYGRHVSAAARHHG